MKKPLFSPPEPFTLSPLLALLPVGGNTAQLEALTSSLYARYEKVTQLMAETASIENKEYHRRLVAEEEMLNQILEWLSVSPDKGGER